MSVKSRRGTTVIDEDGNETTETYKAEEVATVPAPAIPAGVSVKGAVLSISTVYSGGAINLANYETTVTKVDASKLSKTVEVIGNTGNNSIKGGKGADTLNGGSGNDTLTGGAGKDIFVYSSGNDIITDYKTGEDKVQINPSAITNSTLKGSDVILTTGNGTLTVKGVKDKVVTFVDNNGKTTEKIFYADTSYAPLETGLTYDAKRTVLTTSNKYTGTEIDLGEYLGTVSKVNASAVTQALNVTGNALGNSIKGGKDSDVIDGGNGKDTIFGGAGNDSIYGGTDNDILQGEAGNDSLYGGSGNDTLTGGAGNDWFIYEGGNDVITDYKSGEDKIKISSGTISKTTYKNKDVVFTIGSGSLTVKNAQGKEISVTTGSQTQTYSKTFDLLYDCNFMTDEFQIDDISEVAVDDYSIGKTQSVSAGDIFDKATLVSNSSFDKK